MVIWILFNRQCVKFFHSSHSQHNFFHTKLNHSFPIESFSRKVIPGYVSRSLQNRSRFASLRCRKISSQRPHIDLDPNKDSRRRKLTIATYISGFIGFCLLSAIGYRYYGRIKHRAVGIEELKLKEYSFGRRAWLCTYRGYTFPEIIVNSMRDVHIFDVKEDDVWVVTYPKAGTTWVQEVVYLIMNDVDTEKASGEIIDLRVPYFEYPYPGFKVISDMPSPRIIKSHLPLSLLPNQMKYVTPKIIYVARNPKDTLVSLYSFSVKFLTGVPFNGTFDDFCNLFPEGKVIYGPWWKHITEAWQRKDEENILFLFYEDLQMDTAKAVRAIAEFLGRSLSDHQIERIVEYTKFENMKSRSSTNRQWMKEWGKARKEVDFYRKGQVGNWKNHLSDDVAKQLDEMIKTRLPEDLAASIKDSLTE